MKNATQNYQVLRRKFGDWEKIRLSNGINEIALVPAFGGHLLELNMEVQGAKINILDSYSSAAALKEKAYSKGSLLLPFPNRLKDGSFQHQGKTYQFPINNPETQNSLHGFDDFYQMSIKNIDIDEDYAAISLFHAYNGKNASYPFPFELTMTYALCGYNELECTIHLFNPNDVEIPIGFGWHPYFKLGKQVEDLILEMPKSSLVRIDERMLPTGKETPFSDFETPQKIGKTSFDNCFRLHSKIGNAAVNLVSETHNTKITYWQEADKFPFFQLFTPPQRKSIAIEPMTCNVDAFNNGDGLMILRPKEGFAGKFGVKVRKYL